MKTDPDPPPLRPTRSLRPLWRCEECGAANDEEDNPDTCRFCGEKDERP